MAKQIGPVPCACPLSAGPRPSAPRAVRTGGAGLFRRCVRGPETSFDVVILAGKVGGGIQWSKDGHNKS